MAVAAYDNLEKRVAAIDSGIVDRCVVEVGDCRLVVAEQRNTLTQGHTAPECNPDGDADEFARCVAPSLIEAGKASEVADYFGYQNWCTNQLFSCTARLEREAERAARRARAEKRRQAIETSEVGRDAADLVMVAADQMQYTRITLPPSGQELCTGLEEVNQCKSERESRLETFKTELNKDPAVYDADKATEMYVAAQRLEADCYDRERLCVIDQLAIEHGATAKTKQKLQWNYDLIGQRQKLRSQLQPSVAQSCVDDAAIKYQDKIAAAYRIYTRQTVLYFRLQLHKRFAAMHQRQLACLASELKAARAATACDGAAKAKSCRE